MRNYQVTLNNGDVHNVNATHWQSNGQHSVAFYRRHPASPAEGLPYNPEAPYFDPLSVAMFTDIRSVILIEEE